MSEELSFALSVVGGLLGAALLIVAWASVIDDVRKSSNAFWQRGFSLFFVSVAFALVIWLIFPATFVGDKTEAVFNLSVARFWEITKNFAILALTGLGIWKVYELFKSNSKAKTEKPTEDRKE